ncbi:MAG: Gfo/Idh/MocA family oxidoreductase [Actinomycetia bacterium]|nr:Gfo/Idh/MocA family oxidoreductase [Actinomycetes bacterium]
MAAGTVVRYGIIGTGMMGIEHIENINALEGATVTAISDPDAGSRALGQKVARLDDDAVFVDHRDLLASGVVDAVVLSSPNFTHAEILADIIESDLHFLAEKPLCTTIEDAVAVVEHARGHGAVGWMGLEYRYKPPIAKLVAEVHAGVVGDVKMVAIREHRFPFLPKVGDWNRFKSNTGGTLVEKCCHFFDLMTLIIGSDPVRVYASGSQAVNHLDERYDEGAPDILDNAFVIVDYANGARASLDLCMFAEGSRNEQEVSVVGDAAKMEAFVPENLVRYSYRDARPLEEVTVTDDRITYPGLHEGASYLEHLDFLDAIRNGTPPKVTLEDGLMSVAVGIAAHRSIDEGRPLYLSEVLG